MATSLSEQFNKVRQINESLEQSVQERTRELRENEEKFRTVADYTYDWERWDGPDGALLYCSPSCERITGYSPQAFKADSGLLERLVHPEDLASWKAHYETEHGPNRTQDSVMGMARRLVVRILRSDGDLRWVSHLCHPIHDAEQQFKGYRISNRDITERKRAEEDRRVLQEQLHHSQKMESLGLLAGGVAHDMNNVLGAILGLASVHLETLPPSSPVHRAFTTISKACTRGGDLIRRLLGFARQDLAEEKDLDLNALVRDEVRLLERTTLARIRLEIDLAPELRLIRGDAGALAHVLMNLCVNAVDAMPDNGTLRFRTRNVASDGVELEVEDTGCGMSAEVLEKAMNPFFTTKEQGKGTGLGLSIAHTTIKAHHGHLTLFSEPGHGTRVVLGFPACLPTVRGTEAPPAARKEGTNTSLKVLLIDDDELIQSSMQTILEVLGHSTVSAQSGEVALANLEAGFRPDVVILDMNMPGLGGAGTLPRLRALLPAVPVLLATGRADQNALNLLEAYPLVTLLSKPFGVKELQDHLQALGQAE